mmetsp:Transcript_22585/g.59437  ORF Transcript_22585/g.59437 Transcript_22585/m.59437 type:complete len:107 (+) Transcript_22585:31-351(+)
MTSERLTPEAWAASLKLQERIASAIRIAYRDAASYTSVAAFSSFMSALSGVADSSTAPTIAVGQRLPSVVLDSKPGPGKTKQIALAQYVAGKRIILLGLPGAFTAC